MDESEELYDEFGNYIGPDLDDNEENLDEDSDKSDHSGSRQMSDDIESQIKQQ